MVAKDIIILIILISIWLGVNMLKIAEIKNDDIIQILGLVIILVIRADIDFNEIHEVLSAAKELKTTNKGKQRGDKNKINEGCQDAKIKTNKRNRKARFDPYKRSKGKAMKNNNEREDNTISLSIKPKQTPNVNRYENIDEPTVTYRHNQINNEPILAGLNKRLNPRTGKMEDRYTKSCLICKRLMKKFGIPIETDLCQTCKPAAAKDKKKFGYVTKLGGTIEFYCACVGCVTRSQQCKTEYCSLCTAPKFTIFESD